MRKCEYLRCKKISLLEKFSSIFQSKGLIHESCPWVKSNVTVQYNSHFWPQVQPGSRFTLFQSSVDFGVILKKKIYMCYIGYLSIITSNNVYPIKLNYLYLWWQGVDIIKRTLAFLIQTISLRAQFSEVA